MSSANIGNVSDDEVIALETMAMDVLGDDEMYSMEIDVPKAAVAGSSYNPANTFDPQYREPRERAVQVADANFFKKFDDDFDESDMKLE